jgi:hypothetical protein
MNPEGIISFCRERFEQTRKLVENTHSGRSTEDFSRAILLHVFDIICSLGKLAQLQSSAQKFAKEILFCRAHAWGALHRGSCCGLCPLPSRRPLRLTPKKGWADPIQHSDGNSHTTYVMSGRLNPQEVWLQLLNQTSS